MGRLLGNNRKSSEQLILLCRKGIDLLCATMNEGGQDKVTDNRLLSFT